MRHVVNVVEVLCARHFVIVTIVVGAAAHDEVVIVLDHVLSVARLDDLLAVRCCACIGDRRGVLACRIGCKVLVMRYLRQASAIFELLQILLPLIIAAFLESIASCNIALQSLWLKHGLLDPFRERVLVLL